MLGIRKEKKPKIFLMKCMYCVLTHKWHMCNYSPTKVLLLNLNLPHMPKNIEGNLMDENLLIPLQRFIVTAWDPTYLWSSHVLSIFHVTNVVTTKNFTYIIVEQLNLYWAQDLHSQFATRVKYFVEKLNSFEVDGVTIFKGCNARVNHCLKSNVLPMWLEAMILHIAWSWQ